MALKHIVVTKNIMLSGPDGTGKSTISDSVIKSFSDKGITYNHIWLRFNHYTAKVVNLFGRITGRSYYKKYTWGKVGYHDYNGIIGSVYIISVYLDHILFQVFFKKKNLKSNTRYLIDRYIIDVIADLIVDTNKTKMIFAMFGPFLMNELKHTNAYILKCDKNIVIVRRPDINDDKSYDKKIVAYNQIASKFNIPQLNTGKMSIEKVVSVIVKNCL